MSIDWGIYISTAQHERLTQREVWVNSSEYCRFAEKLGYHSAWLLEHHFTRYGMCGSPLTLAAYLLGMTEKLKVGTAVSVIPLEHPLRLAENVAMIDQLSSGRLLFGIGRGFFMKDFDVFGVDVKKNHLILEEWTDIMMRAWRDGKVSSDSELIKFPEVNVYPEPFTKPGPPLYVACSSPSRTEWAAKLGIPMMIDYLTEDEEKRSQIELYNEVAAAHDHDPYKIKHMLSCIGFVGEEPEKETLMRNNMIWWESEFLRASKLFDPEYKDVKNYEYYHRQRETAKLSGNWLPEHRIERVLRLNPNGSPQKCIDRLCATLEGTTIGTVVMGFEALANQGLVKESMQRFMEEVAPHVTGLANVDDDSDRAETTQTVVNAA